MSTLWISINCADNKQLVLMSNMITFPWIRIILQVMPSLLKKMSTSFQGFIFTILNKDQIKWPIPNWPRTTHLRLWAWGNADTSPTHFPFQEPNPLPAYCYGILHNIYVSVSASLPEKSQEIKRNKPRGHSSFPFLLLFPFIYIMQVECQTVPGVRSHWISS